MIILLDSVISFLCISFLLGLIFFFLLMGEETKYIDKTDKEKIFIKSMCLKLLLPLFGALILVYINYMSQKLSLGELALCLAGGYCMGFACTLLAFKKIKAMLVQLIPVLVMGLYIFLKMEFILVIALAFIFLDVAIKCFILKIFKKIFKFLNLTK